MNKVTKINYYKISIYENKKLRNVIKLGNPSGIGAAVQFELERKPNSTIRIVPKYFCD